MAAIAPSRIASGGGIFHKAPAHDAGAADGTDASSPFQQMVSTEATSQTAGNQAAPNQSAPDHTGKKSGKDSKSDGKTGHAHQSAKNQIIAAADSKTLIQAGAANDDGPDDAGKTKSDDGGAVTGENSDAPGATQDSASSAQTAPDSSQTLPDPSQTLAAAQIPISADGTSGKKTDANGNAVAATPDAPNDTVPVQTGSAQTTSVPTAPVQTASAPTASAQTVSAVPAKSDDASSATSQAPVSGKAKNDGKDAIDSQAPTKDSTVPADSAAQPITKKDHKPGKTRDQDSAQAANSQTTPSDPTVVMAASPALPPASTPTPAADADQSSDDEAAAVAAAGQSKGAAKNSQAGSSPAAGAKAPAQSNGTPGGPLKSNSAASPSGAPATAQDGSAAQGASPSGDTNPALPADDKADKQADPVQQPQAAPQPQSQAAQQQAQPAILPAIQPQQAHAGATSAITQNVQVSQLDSSSSANTVSALAVAIAARSQSGNKQFDIRLDPPELGRVEVRLSIDATGKAQASLSADQPHTLDLLKNDAPALTRALRDAGLNVSQNGLNFSLRGQDRQSGGNNFAPRSGRASQQSLIATSAIGSVQSGANYQGPADGRLDIRV